jgi:hypothetical protein
LAGIVQTSCWLAAMMSPAVFMVTSNGQTVRHLKPTNPSYQIGKNTGSSLIGGR